MSDWTIYHNPRCRKSREALELLREKGIEPKVVEYMKEPLRPKQIELLLMKLNIPASQLLRKKEAIFKQKYSKFDLNEHEWVKVMSEEPRLMERPIVERGHAAVIARPTEKVLDLIKKDK